MTQRRLIFTVTPAPFWVLGGLFWAVSGFDDPTPTGIHYHTRPPVPDTQWPILAVCSLLMTQRRKKVNFSAIPFYPSARRLHWGGAKKFGGTARRDIFTSMRIILDT